MSNIVYTTRTCPYCVMAKQLLARQGVPFEERVLDSYEELMRIKAEYKWSTVPIVILNGKMIGGYDQTRELVAARKLEEALGRGNEEQ